jgi:hypothetical protein
MGEKFDTLEDALEGQFDEDQLLEEFSSYRGNLEWEEWFQGRLESIAQNMDLMWDETCEGYRYWHHNGLSCWALESTSAFGAMMEAKMLDIDNEIAQSGFGQYTVGAVEIVAQVPGVENLWVLECDSAPDEEKKEEFPVWMETWLEWPRRSL